VRPVRPPSGSDDANAESLRCHVLRPPGSAADAARSRVISSIVDSISIVD